MKNILLAILASSALTITAVAQGTVNWLGGLIYCVVDTNSTVYSTFGGQGGQATGGGSVGFTAGSRILQFYYELLVSSVASAAPTTVSDLGNWADTGLSATNLIANNGRFTAINPSNAATANNWPAGATANIVLVGWSANLGSTYASVVSELQNWSIAQTSIADAAFFGVSAMGTLASGTGTPGVVVFGTNPGQINNSLMSGNLMQLDLLPVPEPSTLALAALGGSSLCLLRWRARLAKTGRLRMGRLIPGTN